MTSMTAFTQTPAWTLATALGRYEQTRREVEVASTLGRAELRLMWLLAQGDPMTLRDVADHLGLEQSTVNRQVNTALEAGLVRRFRAPGCSVYQIEVTEHGAQLFSEDAAWNLGLLDKALAALPPEQRITFPALLSEFVEAYAHALTSSHPAGQVSTRP
ncbi:MAG: MarR family winged helix-turn-helix transcriptional regulator [Nocardioides sp.]|uniref:MarR family winged helix-turn-helix transcriptional regulator n=1 Tax=Nocardioides sp. TaxID=35761 RepID=UPI0039E63953